MLGSCVGSLKTVFLLSVDIVDSEMFRISFSKMFRISLSVDSKMFCYVTPETPGKSKSLQLLAWIKKHTEKQWWLFDATLGVTRGSPLNPFTFNLLLIRHKAHLRLRKRDNAIIK